MGDLLHIEPKLHFPLLTVFEVGDQFNKRRGRFFYRDVHGKVRGPFLSKLTAALDLLKTCPTSGVPMRTPFKQDEMWWWKKDTPAGVSVEGPYEFEIEADFAIRRYLQELKDKADDRYR